MLKRLIYPVVFFAFGHKVHQRQQNVKTRYEPFNLLYFLDLS